MNKKRVNRGSSLLFGAAVAATTGLGASSAQALPLYDEGGSQLNFDFEAIVGAFHSDESYALLRSSEGSVSWQEGYAKYGLSGSASLGSTGGELFGAASLLTSLTRGDGDAAGFTSGDEDETDVEDLYVGWRSGNLIPGLGENGFEVSVGRQNVTLGDGFLINGDALNLGEGFKDLGVSPDFDRGGAYWLAARKAFDKTAVVRVGGAEGLRSDLFWLESDNLAQAQMELAGINLEYVGPAATLALTYIEGLDVDADSAAILGLEHRDGQETWSVRAQGSAGIENLFLSAQFVDQSQGDNSRRDANAYYLEAGWTFADLPWSPGITYRYSDFDEDFDPLFFGFNRGYGTWFQGEVAANYAGPFNSDAQVHHLGLKLAPSETLTLGALFFQFDETAGGSGALDGQEINFYAEWVAADHLIISPLVGFYSPDNSAAEGGTQIGNDDTNTYAQVIAIVPF
ncbi:hypothetical protein [Motiliproteus sp. SC1-56]|uniref:hypothetical protein n=1 Tax=Motiliproteus sp. SC1-56 TaxID=2799565 RepID=UPI001A8CC096|nr:hypothetical protein [Motiliproteus sp. SC1-56]